MATRVDTLEPLPGPEPEPERPPGRKLTAARVDAREPLRSKLDTVADGRSSGCCSSGSSYRIGRFVFVDARWEVVERNITNLMVGGFPRDELWRLWAALFVLAALARLRRRRDRRAACAARSRRGARARCRKGGVRRLGRRSSLLVVVLLWFAQSLRGDSSLVAAIAAVGAAFDAIGRRTPERLWRYVPLSCSPGPRRLHRRDRVRRRGLERLGRPAPDGLPGRRRRSCCRSRSACCWRSGGARACRSCAGVCVAYIELIRGVPLITLLFMAFFMIGFFLPGRRRAEPRHPGHHRLHPLHGRLRRRDRARRAPVGAARARSRRRRRSGSRRSRRRSASCSRRRCARSSRRIVGQFISLLQGHVARLRHRADASCSPSRRTSPSSRTSSRRACTSRRWSS